MVSPISSVRFGNAPVDLAREGAHSKAATKPETAPASEAAEPKKSKHKVLKTVIGLAVAAAALVTLHKTNVLKTLDTAILKDTKWYSPKLIGHYLSKAGEKIAKFTYDPLVNLFKKAPKAADGAAEGAADAVAAGDSATTAAAAVVDIIS